MIRCKITPAYIHTLMNLCKLLGYLKTIKLSTIFPSVPNHRSLVSNSTCTGQFIYENMIILQGIISFYTLKPCMLRWDQMVWQKSIISSLHLIIRGILRHHQYFMAKAETISEIDMQKERFWPIANLNLEYIPTAQM